MVMHHEHRIEMKSENIIVVYALFWTLFVSMSDRMAFNLINQYLIPVKKIADWQIQLTYNTSNDLHDYGIGSWTNATLYPGILRWAGITENSILPFCQSM